MTVRRPLLACALALACVPLLTVPATSPAHAVAVEPECSSVGRDDVDVEPIRSANDANDELHVPEATALARKAGRKPGQGVTVVVVDSGFDDLKSRAPSALENPHGLIVAGIIGGPDQPRPKAEVGIARDARLLSAGFYVNPRGAGEEGKPPPTAGEMIRQFDAITARRKGDLKGRLIVVVPIEVMRTDALEKAVDRLVNSGALVIAASGDRPTGTNDDDTFLAGYSDGAKAGEDAVADVWPAAADNADGTKGVISVGVSAPDGISTVLRNSGIDLAAPGTGSISKGLNGKWCKVTTISSHWAAAQVAGVAALVWSVHSKDTAVQLRERLQDTATGNGAAVSPLTGYGVVQPVEAIQRDLEPRADQDNMADVVPRATVPPKRADVLAKTRDNAVWWGLGGGGALMILLVLRPVLARRRAGGSGVRR